MGKVIFLNEASRRMHEEQGIKISNPPDLTLVVNKPKAKSAKKTKSGGGKRMTMGQRIYQRMQEEKGNPEDAG